jgi:hypothetical protein
VGVTYRGRALSEPVRNYGTAFSNMHRELHHIDLRSTPDCRPRRAFLHLSYSYAPPCGPALLVTQCHKPTNAVQQAVILIKHLVGASEQCRWNFSKTSWVSVGRDDSTIASSFSKFRFPTSGS